MNSSAVDPAEPGDAREISREEIAARLNDPSLVLVDVLPKESFEDAHIPGSLSLPVPEIPQRARTVLGSDSREIAVYCASPT